MLIKMTYKAFLKQITARLYSAHQPAALVPVPSRCSSTNPQDARLPFVETVMGQSSVQPCIHNVLVLVHHKGADGRSAISKFRIFFKRHVRLPYNWRLDLQGDIVVMRIASRSQSSVVNLRRSDNRIADFIVASLAEKLRVFQGPKRKQLRTEFLVMPFRVRARARRT
ncbi:hypothetical protein C8F04DRAFT_1267290 [Mycena alexandri]|uniref:Uncharacterized protein n=1 Tax=Mycena alexandri TaxID=1745969 RepID=A0AAD6SGB0_9AGAR|nr:hypothetical protein C8F04DRAFT_1267290 [Mycena alexandri]